MFSSHSPGTCYNGALWALCYSMQYLGIQSRFQTTLVHTLIFYICQKINVRSCNFRYLCLLLNQPAIKNPLVPRANVSRNFLICCNSKIEEGRLFLLFSISDVTSADIWCFVVCVQSHADVTKETLDANIQIRLLSMSKRL